MAGRTRSLEEAVKHPDNANCADCGAPCPRWASFNIGVFVCIDCSGIHRGIGTHITKIRSITLDHWDQEAIATMCAIGNRRANAYYEAKLPKTFNRAALAHNRQRCQAFIEDKYKRLAFADTSRISPAEALRRGVLPTRDSTRSTDKEKEPQPPKKPSRDTQPKVAPITQEPTQPPPPPPKKQQTEKSRLEDLLSFASEDVFTAPPPATMRESRSSADMPKGTRKLGLEDISFPSASNDSKNGQTLDMGAVRHSLPQSSDSPQRDNGKKEAEARVYNDSTNSVEEAKTCVDNYLKEHKIQTESRGDEPPPSASTLQDAINRNLMFLYASRSS